MSGPGLFEVSEVGEARNIHGNDRHWPRWDRLPVAREGDGILEFVEKLSLRFKLLGDNTQICLQDNKMPTKMTIFLNIFRLNVVKDAMGASHFMPRRPYKAF